DAEFNPSCSAPISCAACPSLVGAGRPSARHLPKTPRGVILPRGSTCPPSRSPVSVKGDPMTSASLRKWIALVATITILGSAPAKAELLTGLLLGNRVATFDSATPGTLLTNVSITGLQGGETLLGIDRRPADGLLYGIGSTSRLYTLNTTTGA